MKKQTLAYTALGLGALAAAVVVADKANQFAPATHPNPDAPARTDQTMRIQASPERVWQVLSQIDRWATWQSDIHQPHLNGPLQPGTSFDWKTGGVPIHSTLHTVEPGRALGWSGTTFGAFAVHNWTLTVGAGYTDVRVEEGMEGWLVRLLKPVFQRSLGASITLWLALLKQEAEKAAAA